MGRPIVEYIVNGKQVCRKCKADKPVDEFWTDRANPAGISRYCKICADLRRKESRQRKKDGTLKTRNKWPQKGTGEYELFRRNHELIRTYGIDIIQYNNLFEAQGGCCGICSRHQSELKRPLDVDHDHNTGAIRGLLCSKCNTGVGLFHDRTYLLSRALNYLQRSKAIAIDGFNFN